MLDRYGSACTSAPTLLAKDKQLCYQGEARLIELPVAGTQQVRQAAVGLLQSGRRALMGKTGQKCWRIWTSLLQKGGVKMPCSCFRRLMQVARTPRP